MKSNFTEGSIIKPLVSFALPVLFAMILQTLYSAVDLLVVGRFASTADVSGVSTGGMVTHTITNVVTGLAMGITVIIGQSIGEKNKEKANRAIGSGVFLFLIFAVIMTLLVTGGAPLIAGWLDAPAEAFAKTVLYIRICGMGYSFVVAFNVIGSIFRGIGDSKTPLMTVGIACGFNIVLDLLFVGVMGLGAGGAAMATIFAQGISVALSLLVLRKKPLPFEFSWKLVRFDREMCFHELKLGIPISLQDVLTSISFLIVQMVVNGMGVVASAGVGIGEKISVFLMLVPLSCMQAMSAFVAQNIGAGKKERAKKALSYGILISLVLGIVMSYLSFAQGDTMAGIFTQDALVIAATQEYLKAYALECFLTSFVFCFMGFYNGCGKTMFVMIQGLVGAFGVRTPLVLWLSGSEHVTLFKIGLATPTATAMQLVLCLIVFIFFFSRFRAGRKGMKTAKS